MIDLHTHSTFSDGTLTPVQLVRAASQTPIQVLALTDHDTTDGIPLAQEAAVSTGITLVPGVELSCLYKEKEIHIVGLFVQWQNEDFHNLMEHLQETRLRRNLHLVKTFNENQIPMDLDDVAAYTTGQNISRIHFAKFLVEQHYVSTMKTAFIKYLMPGGLCYVPRELIAAKDAFDIIHHAGGIAVLAHPTLYKMDYTQIGDMVKQLKKYDLDGIECYYSTFTTEDTNQMLSLAYRYSLLPSGGSDYHGAMKPLIELGIGKGNLNIPIEIYEQLYEKALQLYK